MEFLIEFDLFSWLFSDPDASCAWHWQIENKKLINKGTGREYLYDTSKKGYDLGNDMIIEETYIENCQKTAKDKWELCQEDDETFKIKCKNDGSFIKANYDYDADCITSGNLSLLQRIKNHTNIIDLDKKSGHQRLALHEKGYSEGSISPSFSTNK